MSIVSAGVSLRAYVATWSALLIAIAITLLGVAPLALPDSYSWIEHGTSESAAQGVDGAWVARMGFLAFGLGVLTLAQVRVRAWGPIGALLHVLFGVSMFGVAAFSARSWDETAAYVAGEDSLHGLFAGLVGFGFIVGMIAVIVYRRYENVADAVPEIIPLAVASITPLLMSTSVWGMLQRVMFLVAALWYMREALSQQGLSAAGVLTTHRRDEGFDHEQELNY